MNAADKFLSNPSDETLTPSIYEGYCVSVEEMNSMTMQTALRNNNTASVLVTDKRQSQTTGLAGNSIVEKFRIEGDLVYAWSGDNDLAKVAGHMFADEYKAGKIQKSNIEESLRAAGKASWIRRFGNSQSPIANQPLRRLLVFIWGDIWVLDVSFYSTCERIDDKLLTGDYSNTAKFFLECYYDSSKSLLELALLGAHVVLMGSKLNRTYVGGGLDIIVIENGKPRILMGKEKEFIVRQSQAIDDEISRLLRVTQSESKHDS